MASPADLALWCVAAIALLVSACAARRDLALALVVGVPALIGATAGLSAVLTTIGVDLGAALALAVLLVACALIAEIDRRSLLIPDPLVVAIVLIALVAPFSPAWDHKIVGAALVGGLFLGVRWAFERLARTRALGLGDVKLAAAMGATVGAHDGLIAVAIAGVATLCGMTLAMIGAARAHAAPAPAISTPTISTPARATPLSRARGVATEPAPFGIGLAAALAAVSAFRLWSGA